MNEKEIKIAIGGLLHDVGKVLFRYNDGRNHSTSGYEFLKNNVGLNDQDILNQVRYHHSNGLKSANLEKNSLAYITYIADNIASAADRRKTNEEGTGFVRELPLETVFNILNENDDDMRYNGGFLQDDSISYPTKKEPTGYNEGFYGRCVDNIADSVKGISFDESYINSLLEVLEANLSFVPSSTSLKEKADISLFDHLKLTAALGNCIYTFLVSQDIDDYHNELFLKASEFYGKKAFLLYSIDISGIQDFIYTISSDGALKTLRSRSFYLEMLMEHIVDEILLELNLSRANLLYNGGGHAYIIAANTDRTKQILDESEKEINGWFLSVFGTDLYIAGGYAPCSATDIQNVPQGSYKEIFKSVSNDISLKKSQRYTAAEITKLNNSETVDGERECNVCGRVETDLEQNKCSICFAIERFSKEILYKDFFSIVKNKNDGLPLPNGCSLVADTEQSLRERMENSPDYKRSYCKNEMHTGYNISTKVWVAEGKKGVDFRELANSSNGIRRLGVLRADVDNLSKAFVGGFESEKNKDYFVTLSRTATLSRKLSIFFKRNINSLLRESGYSLNFENGEERNIAIVYSGGDDLFAVGSWSDIIGFAVDLQEAFERFSQSTLTLSAGIGIFPETYPISAMARQTQELEEKSKSNEEKNSVTLFDGNGCYDWNTFINEVLEDKYLVIQELFENRNGASDKYGKSYLYNLLELLRNKDQKINIARIAYFLARMEPKPNKNDVEGQEFLEKYKAFSKKVMSVISDDEQCRQFITAIYIYVYGTRENEEETK